MTIIRCRLKPYIQPFERILALEELKILSGTTPIPVDGKSESALIYSVQTKTKSSGMAEKLAYWEYVEGHAHQLTSQVCLEATVNVVRNGVPFPKIQTSLPFGNDAPLPNRRCLRYGTHGIHEYRGKFFPQLVRALINTASLRTKALVGDPMCGSGTTLVEALVLNHRAIGIDLNPLSVLISEVKCSLLFQNPKQLEFVYEELRRRLLREKPNRSGKLPYFSSLPAVDQEYLKRWFAPSIIADLDQIMVDINSTSGGIIRDLMRLSLSNIIRRVSWQKDDDLRVRKEVRLDEEIDPIREFLGEMGKSVRTVVAFLRQNGRLPRGFFEIQEGDARVAEKSWSEYSGKLDAIITSPPYATALPYLDTDRLSLIYLKLLARPEHRKRDKEMIGNREINGASRTTYWEDFQKEKAEFPKSIVSMVEDIDRLNTGSDAGFRRLNLASLLAKYFTDMRLVLGGVSKFLRKGAPAFVVVGNNHTVAGGRNINIDTARLLADLARNVGLRIERRISMEMLVSRDIFKRNTGSSEYILCLRKPA